MAQRVQRSSLPIPDRRTRADDVDAKDPDSPRSRRSSRCCPPDGRAERPRHPYRRRRVRGVERLRRPLRHAELSMPRGRRLQLHALPHDRPVLTDTRRPCSPAATTIRSGWARSPRSPHRPPATPRCGRTPRRRSRETLKLNGYSTAQFGKCHEVPVWQSSADGPVRRLALGRRRLRVLLRLHRRREQPVGSGAVRAARRPSSRRRRPRRATTSPRTSPTTLSAGSASRRR